MRFVALAPSLALGLLLAGRAGAHDPFEITSDARVDAHGLNMHTTLSLDTAARACLVGAERDRRLVAADFQQLRPAFERCARSFFALSAGGKSLAVRSVALRLGAEDDLEMRLVYARPATSPLMFDAQALMGLGPRAGVVLTVTGQRTFLGQKVLRPDDARLELPITEDGEAIGTPLLPSFARFLRLGLEHILSGADHLVFLLALLVVCKRWQTVAIIVSCFTVAHSISLMLATLDVITCPRRLVEALIAATIVLTGLENLYLGQEPEGRWSSRWLVTFVFGLVHGLGFAGALRESGLGTRGTSIWLPLLAFNLGVELGQLAVACVLLALLWRLGKSARFSRLPRVLSIAVTVLGLFWLLQRVTT